MFEKRRIGCLAAFGVLACLFGFLGDTQVVLRVCSFFPCCWFCTILSVAPHVKFRSPNLASGHDFDHRRETLVRLRGYVSCSFARDLYQPSGSDAVVSSFLGDLWTRAHYPFVNTSARRGCCHCNTRGTPVQFYSHVRLNLVYRLDCVRFFNLHLLRPSVA
jgi:hypothetical protein